MTTVCDDDIVAFLAKLINGEISLQEAKDFFDGCMYAFSDDALEAVMHYLDDYHVCEKDLGYEIWSKLGILDAYCSYVHGEDFSIWRYARCLACRLGCRYRESAGTESRSLCISRCTSDSIWELEMEFFVGRARVIVREGSSCSDCEVRQLYYGPWLGLDFLKLRKCVLSGDVEQMRRFAEGCREDDGGYSSGTSSRSDAGGADACSDNCAGHGRNVSVESLLAKFINGEIPLHDAEALFEQSRHALPDSVRTAVSHYIDSADVWKEDLEQELWSRLYLLEEYISCVRDEKFSIKQYVHCLACRLGCRFGGFATKESVGFWMTKRSWFRFWNDTWFLYWNLRIEFFLGRVLVEEIEGPLFRPSKRKLRQIYDGPWPGLDFEGLRKRILDSRYGL